VNLVIAFAIALINRDYQTVLRKAKSGLALTKIRGNSLVSETWLI